MLYSNSPITLNNCFYTPLESFASLLKSLGVIDRNELKEPSVDAYMQPKEMSRQHDAWQQAQQKVVKCLILKNQP